MAISKTLYNTCCQLFQDPDKIQLSNTLTKEIIKQTGYGHDIRTAPTRRGAKAKYHFHLASGEHELLREYILKNSGLDIATDAYARGDRVENAAINSDEKLGASASQDIILVNNPTATVKLNQESTYLFSSIACAGIELRHQHIVSIEHDAIIICENFTPMYYLSQLADNPVFANALVLYRGDSQNGKRADQVINFLTRFRAHIPIYYFGDLDPAGLDIAKSFNVAGVILPCINQLTELDDLQLKALAGKDKYFPHIKKKGHHHVLEYSYPVSWRQHIQLINRHQLGLQQEHLINAEIKWQLYT